MKFLIILNKFDIDKNKLINKILRFSENSEVEINGTYLILKTNKINRDEFLKMHEIKEIIELNTEWKELNFRILKEDCLSAIKGYNSYLIKTNFLNKIPLSAKSVYKHINPYLKHEGLIVSEKSPDAIIYLEFKKDKNKILYIIGIIKNNNKKEIINVELNNFSVLLEEPRLVEEISDFIRVCYIFKLNLFILTKNKSPVERLLIKAKKITKGIIYENFKIDIISSMPKDYTKVGFTKHANENESNLLDLLKNNKEKICLIFGNDTYGLSQEIRDSLDYCFRLTPEIKKPLKANQALSYVLGLYNGQKVISM